MIFYLLKTDLRFPTVINYWPIAYLAQPVTTPVSKSIFQSQKLVTKSKLALKKLGDERAQPGSNR
jgi:hypothetical protein